MKELLVGESNDSAYRFHLAMEQAKEDLSKEEMKEVDEGMEILREKWFSLSAGTRRACVPSFVQFEEVEEMEGADAE